MRMQLSLRPPPGAAHLSAAASAAWMPPLPARRSVGPLAASASAAAEFPGSVPEGAQMPPRRRRRRSVAGIDQDELLDPDALADPDSSFLEINGVRLHHKVCSCEDEADTSSSGGQSADATAGRSQIGIPILLLHGFGASVFSWSRVMRPLARVAGSKVLAFDRPAFGLTSRVSSWSRDDDTKALNPYSMAFAVMSTLAFIDYLGAEKAVLVGHSAGCLVAVETYFEAPERVAALVLVAPAIFAPRRGVKDGGSGDRERQQGSTDQDSPQNMFTRIWGGFLELCVRIAGLVWKLATAIRDVFQSLCLKAFIAVLRSSLGVVLIRWIMDKFGILGVRNAWYDPSQVTDHVIQGYTKPLRSKDWERALVEHTISMITDSKSRTPVSKRLSEISCPVLVMTGDTDRIVPAWNAERLARIIPGATFELIKNCGHLPQEERSEEFLSVVDRFLRTVFGAPEQVYQAAV